VTEPIWVLTPTEERYRAAKRLLKAAQEAYRQAVLDLEVQWDAEEKTA
jgi:hypothetical protein